MMDFDYREEYWKGVSPCYNQVIKTNAINIVASAWILENSANITKIRIAGWKTNEQWSYEQCKDYKNTVANYYQRKSWIIWN